MLPLTPLAWERGSGGEGLPILVFALILLLFGISFSPARAQPASWCIAVWYPSSDDPTGADSITDNLDVIDVIHPFWYTTSADGSIITQRGIEEDQEQLAEWREAGLVIMPSILTHNSSMLDSEESIAAHIEEIVALVERMDYDGIDIDYESFPLSTRDSFSDFIEQLSEALHERDRLLSIAVHAKTDDAGAWEGAAAQDWTRIAPAVDIFNIMTYDYTSRNQPPGLIAPSQWTLDVLAYAESIIDLSKVRMGLHFYGYSWLRGSPPATTTSWTAAQRLIDSFDLEVTREDDEARIDLDVRGLPDQTYYFADAEFVSRRLNRVYDAFPSLGGVAIFGVGPEDPANWDILRDTRPAECAFG